MNDSKVGFRVDMKGEEVMEGLLERYDLPLKI